SLAIQPSRPSSSWMFSQLPSAFCPSTSTRVPGRRASNALKPVPGPSRTFTVLMDAIIPIMGGTSVGVGVSDGVGGIGDTDGVNVNVGSGVRLGTGGAVNRGVMLTIGASVAVGGSELISVLLQVQAAIIRPTPMSIMYLCIPN